MDANRRRLNGLDGAFLALESPTVHFHIAAVLVCDPSAVPGGVDFTKIRDHVARRVSLVAPFRHRIVEVPFGLQHPTLIDDPAFDVDFHVRRVSLPAPGGPGELAAVVGDLIARPLDRHRPLWEIHVVEGLGGGRFALVAKVHHAIIDGVSGAEVMAAFFDSTPMVEHPAHAESSGRCFGDPIQRTESNGSALLPGKPDCLLEALGDVLSVVPKQAGHLVQTIGRTLQTARNLNGWNRSVNGILPPAPFDAPCTSINRAISAHRRVTLAQVPMSDVHLVRSVLGGTVNDVALAVTAGALRTFFAQRGEWPERSLVAMVPISVREDADQAKLGNRVSAMLVSLATGVDDPVARLRLIRDGISVAKDQHRAVGAGVFADWAQALSPAVATRVSRLATNLRLFDHLPPPFNVVVSNVRGPEVPLFLAGAELVSIHPLGPIVEGVGVNITHFSYRDVLYVGVQACSDLVPDVDVIGEAVPSSLSALVLAANRRNRPVPWWHEELPAGA